MSNYTTQLRNICESFAGDVTASSPARKVDAVLDASHSKIFDFEYPIFDETYKEHLEKKILRHFYFREIGCETYGQWQVQLDAKMNEIMPYYNQLYASENLVIDPLLSYREHSEQITDDDRRTRSEDSGHDDDVFGDTVTDTFGKTVTNSGTDTDRYNDTITDNFGKIVTDGGVDSNKFTPGTTDTVQRTPNITRTRTGNESDNTTDTQTVAATHGQTNWDITSDTPQGGLNNIIGSGSAVSTPPGTPQGGLTYASQIAEHTSKSEDNSGASTHNTTHTYNSVQDAEAGTDTNVTSHTGFDVNEATYGKTVTDSGSQSQAHTGTTGHEHGHIIADSGTQSQAHTGKQTRNYGKIVDGTDNFDGSVTVDRSGFTSGQHELLKQYRENMLNIDQMVLDDMNELFMGLYNF